MADARPEPAVPNSFRQYARSMGPGLIVALTWLGAGDMVDSAIAGGNYGYTLMWAMVAALTVRFVFVSIIAKYQLCNQHGESVMSGMKRLHRLLPMGIVAMAVLFSHFYASYAVRGVGEATARLAHFGPAWGWSIFWVAVGVVFVLSGSYRRLEFIFYLFLIMLSVSLLGVAGWAGPDPLSAAKGVLLFEVPEQRGSWGALLVVTSLIGAVGGSIANLLYPYFIQQKGWRGPRYRRLQLYDLAFGTAVIIILNLSVWTIGAELLNPRGITIETFDDLANLLTLALGDLGGPIFYLGVFAALYSSMIGGAVGFGYLVTDSIRVHKADGAVPALPIAVSRSKIYRAMILWALVSPLVWILPGTPGFILLVLLAGAATVVVLPVLCGALWMMTARASLIGAEYRNKPWENAVLAGLFVLSAWSAYEAVLSIIDTIG